MAARLQRFHATAALLSLAFVLAAHGASAAWALGFATLGRAALPRLPPGRAGLGAVWAYAALAVLLTHTLQSSKLSHAAASLLPGLAGPPLAAGATFKYTVLRFLSYATDWLSGSIQAGGGPGWPAQQKGSAGLACERSPLCEQTTSPATVSSGADGRVSAGWAAYWSYMLFGPLYLVGPILTAQDFLQQAGSLAATVPSAAEPAAHTSSGSNSRGSRVWTAQVLQLAAWVAFIEAARRSCYAPEVLLPRYESLWWVALVVSLMFLQYLSHETRSHMRSPLPPRRPWQAWFSLLGVLVALWLQSLVPWAWARLAAGALGIETLDETPLGLLAASTSARTFWRSFHASWHRWLVQYVYAPLGRGTWGAAAVMGVSTALHAIWG